MSDPTAEQIIKKLGLEPLPWEGGFFKRTHASIENVEVIRQGKRVLRPAGTSILYLITRDNFSAFHKVASDETFHFYMGATVELITLGKSEGLSRITLSHHLSFQAPQFTVRANLWQALRIVVEQPAWSLLGTSVSPGFDYEDFELGERSALLSEYPAFEADILKLTRD